MGNTLSSYLQDEDDPEAAERRRELAAAQSITGDVPAISSMDDYAIAPSPVTGGTIASAPPKPPTQYQQLNQQLQEKLAKRPGTLRTIGGIAAGIGANMLLHRIAPGSGAQITEQILRPGVSNLAQRVQLAKQAQDEALSQQKLQALTDYRTAQQQATAQNRTVQQSIAQHRAGARPIASMPVPLPPVPSGDQGPQVVQPVPSPIGQIPTPPQVVGGASPIPQPIQAAGQIPAPSTSLATARQVTDPLTKQRGQIPTLEDQAAMRRQSLAEATQAAQQEALRGPGSIQTPQTLKTAFPELGDRIMTDDLKKYADAALEKHKLEISQISKPEDYMKLVDQVVPPNVKENAPLNARTKALVQSAIAQGDIGVAKAAITSAAAEVRQLEVATDPRIKANKIEISAAGAEARAKLSKPSDAGVEMLAENILNGQYPSSRNPVLYKLAVDRAAELAKERGLTNQQVILQRNAAQASKAAFTAVTKQYEMLKPFATMAEKNADILEKKAALVTDLGGSFFNTPVRNLEDRFAGNKNVAAYRASLLPVQADFARILNSPTGAGVISDHARQEMQGALSVGATPGQIKAALDVFRQDARNRRESYEASLKDLQGRTIASPPKAEVPAQAANGPAAVGANMIVQRNKISGEYRYSADGGKTWQQGQPQANGRQ